jgi:hypothetical protein
MFEHDYQEVDSSPMATMTLRFFEELQAQKAASGVNFWEEECRTRPHLTKCKIYCD